MATVGAFAVATVVAVGVMPASAHAAPKKPTPSAVKIASKELGDSPIVVQKSAKAALFGRLLSEVNWLATAKPQTSAPEEDKLGPKYTMTVLIKDKAQQVYDLYPLASGGPRAHRPAKQPAGKKTDGWFYGRLTMSESLRIAGAPLAEKADVTSGGIGGGIGEEVTTQDIDPMATARGVFDDMRRLFLLNGAVLGVILLGLAGIAFLIRRRV
ncbi:hypothetical protein [Mangrovihabitans endophyticus]|nr:hypothetical protein [Mangrovihabitans endophyticus]